MATPKSKPKTSSAPRDTVSSVTQRTYGSKSYNTPEKPKPPKPPSIGQRVKNFVKGEPDLTAIKAKIKDRQATNSGARFMKKLGNKKP